MVHRQRSCRCAHEPHHRRTTSRAQPLRRWRGRPRRGRRGGVLVADADRARRENAAAAGLVTLAQRNVKTTADDGGALASAILGHAMSDVMLGSERTLSRLRLRLLDTAVITAFAFATLLGVALLVRSSGPVFRVADEDQGPLGPQIERTLISSGQFASVHGT